MWALAIIDPAVYATPYIIAILVCIMVFSVLILRVPMLRSRRKRSIMVWAVMALVLVLLVFQAREVSLGPTHISYRFDSSVDEFYSGQVNQIDISSFNNGIRPASYYLVLKSENATFTTGNQADYIRINSTAIKVPFVFNELKEASESKPMLFDINQNVTSFEFTASIEPNEGSSIVVVTWMYLLRCSWNSTVNCYTTEYCSICTA